VVNDNGFTSVLAVSISDTEREQNGDVLQLSSPSPIPKPAGYLSPRVVSGAGDVLTMLQLERRVLLMMTAVWFRGWLRSVAVNLAGCWA